MKMRLKRTNLVCFCSLSFYKESLAGETDNYVHLRAAAECKSPTDVLRTLAAEVTDTVRRIDAITSVDAELAALWQRFLQVTAVPTTSLAAKAGHLTCTPTGIPGIPRKDDALSACRAWFLCLTNNALNASDITMLRHDTYSNLSCTNSSAHMALAA